MTISSNGDIVKQAAISKDEEYEVVSDIEQLLIQLLDMTVMCAALMVCC